MSKLKFALITSLSLTILFPLASPDSYFWFVAGYLSALVVLRASKAKPKPDKYINAKGYVVLSQSGELEHRHIAKQVLGREIKSTEVVHHVNGKRSDNKINNLCVLSNHKHEHFHSWLRWKKEKSGKYPSIYQQKRVLEQDYGGRLLEKMSLPELEDSMDRRFDAEEPQRPEQKKRLFVALRDERTRIAKERGVPAYVVFDDKTLTEMAEAEPVSETHMLRISGVNQEKFRLYGPRFIDVVRKFKHAG